MARIVLHVDMDSFYTSVEKREDPKLKDQPVIVTQGPKQGRGVVASCSYEARRYGVKSGMPISTAYKLCPDAIYKEASHPLYEQTSERITNILREYADKIEPVSIDEAYLDITSRTTDYKEAEETARKIKQAIKRKERLTCSIGIAPNKTIAKIASAQQKPDGLTTVTPEQAKRFLEPLPVEKLPGVGRKTTEELRRLGVKTIRDLARTPRVTLVEKFGKNGIWMWDAANGIDETPVQETEEMKSISTQRTLEEDTDDWKTIYNTIDCMIEEVHSRAEEEGYLYRTIGVMLTFEDFQTTTRARTLQKHTTSKQAIQENARQLLKEFEPEPRKIRRIGVRVSNLKRKEYAEPPLDQYI
ncbi:MAG: DNA polymerase IV [Nitrososphaerales archaeon]